MNGEGIYGTTFWKQFGEGDVNNEEGFFKDREEKAFTEKDFRFTYKCGSIYAFQMRPNGENAVIKALKKHNTHDFIIKQIGLLLLKFSFALIINSLSFLSNLSAALVEISVILFMIKSCVLCFFKDREEKAFTEKDFRFTYKCG